MPTGAGQPGGNPGENPNRFVELDATIKDAGRAYDATSNVETDLGFEKRPILTAIFIDRNKGKLTDNEAIVLANDWLVQTRNSGGKLFLIQNLVELKLQGLLVQQVEIDKLITALQLSQGDQSIMADNLQYLGWASVVGNPAPFRPTWSPQGLTPNPVIDTTASAAPIDKDQGYETPDPRGFVQRNVKKIGIGIAAAAATALAIGSTSLWRGPTGSANETPAAAAGSATAGSPSGTPPPVAPAASPSTPPPAATATTAAPEAPSTPTATVAPAQAPNPSAPTVAPIPVAVTPSAPEIQTQKTAEFPVVTRQNALGATSINIEASRGQWTAEGWQIEEFIAPNGNRGVKLTKNGKTATISNLRVTPGVEKLTLEPK